MVWECGNGGKGMMKIVGPPSLPGKLLVKSPKHIRTCRYYKDDGTHISDLLLAHYNQRHIRTGSIVKFVKRIKRRRSKILMGLQPTNHLIWFQSMRYWEWRNMGSSMKLFHLFIDHCTRRVWDSPIKHHRRRKWEDTGIAQQILSDRGTDFLSGVNKRFLHKNGIKRLLT